MNANESFEVFAEKFYKKFGYLPCGKDDPTRPSAERILIDLGETYSALLKAESAEKSDNKQSESFLCPKCGATDNIAHSTTMPKLHCFRCDHYWKK